MSTWDLPTSANGWRKRLRRWAPDDNGVQSGRRRQAWTCAEAGWVTSVGCRPWYLVVDLSD